VSNSDPKNTTTPLRVGIVTKEWPPAVYGGAGVHVVQLTEALRASRGITVDVHCFGGARTDGAFGYDTPIEFKDANPAVAALATDLAIADDMNSSTAVNSRGPLFRHNSNAKRRCSVLRI
jgi:starch synthase